MKNLEKTQEAINKLLNMFETGEIPQAIARTVIKQKGYDKPSDRWSLGNKLIMLIHDTTDARGYRQWEEVGRHVKKGAKAFYILAPVYITKKEVVTKVIIDENGEEVKVEEEQVRQVLVGFKEIPVFRYEDTEGKLLPEVDYTPKALPPLVDVAKKYGIQIKYGPFTERFYGFYTPSTNSIMLCSHDVDIFFHELAHAIHNRIHPLKGGQDPYQEIVAETVAGVLCELYGFKGYEYHVYRYIQGYAKARDGKETVKAIMKVLADVERILKIIFEGEEAVMEKVEENPAA